MSAKAIHRLTAALLMVITFTIVLATQRHQGVVRDEVVYRGAGTRYADWWLDLITFTGGTVSEDKITAHFGGKTATANNREHPPLMKTLFGLSEKLFYAKLGWTSQTTAYRLPTVVFNAILVVLVFLFTARLWGYSQGVIAALLVLLLPRALFHAGLATFDAAIVTTWFATIYAYHRALASRWWVLGFALCLGLALATKHNAILIPAAILTHYLWVSLYSQRAELDGSWAARLRALGRGLWRTQPLLLPAMFLLAPLVLIALWPWLWFDTFAHVGDWMSFHFSHVHYNFEYLGENWNHPRFPWHVAIITTLFTVPVVTLVAAVFGLGALAWRAHKRNSIDAARAPGLLLFLSSSVSMGPFLLGTTPIFGAEKHWAPAIPTICIFAGIGVVWASELAIERLVADGIIARARERLATIATTAALACAVVAAATVETIDAQPYALSHYNALAGGAPGGADLGMNRQFWGYSARGTLAFLNQRAQASANLPVYSHDASMAWATYRREELIAKNLPDAGHENRGITRSELALVVHELHFNRHDYMIWKAYGSVQPVFVLTSDGVPLVTVYARDR